MAYKYASKMRRLQLANRISQLAMDLQDKQEEEEEAEEERRRRDADRAEVESSADLFETQASIPWLEEFSILNTTWRRAQNKDNPTKAQTDRVTLQICSLL